MEKVIIKKSKSTLVMLSVCDNPTLGTWGSHQLLVDQYRTQDPDWMKENNRWEQLRFTTNFLNKILEIFKELHCEYCGKPGLLIHAWSFKGNKSLMATGDHFLPKSKHPELSLSESNMKVCCNKCNQKKKDHYWPESSIKFPYPRN